MISSGKIIWNIPDAKAVFNQIKTNFDKIVISLSVLYKYFQLSVEKIIGYTNFSKSVVLWK